MKNAKVIISSDKIRKIEKSHLRSEMIACGFYTKPKHIVMKSSKDYTRKSKHKVNYGE